MLIKKIAGNLFSLSIGNILSQFIVFYSFVYLATVLEPAQFGLFSFAQAVINFFSRATEFGLETIAVRRITQTDKNDSLYANIVVIRSSLSAIVVTLFISIAWLSDFNEMSVVLAVLSLSMIGVSFTVEWKYLAIERMSVVSFIRTVRSLLFFVPLVVLTSQHASVVTASWLFSFSFLFLHGIIFIWVILNKGFSFGQVSKSTIIQLWRESVPIAIANALMQIQYYFSTFTLGIVQDNTAVAVFSAAYRPLLAVWSFGVMAVYNSIFPVMNSVSDDVKEFPMYIRKITKILMLLGVILFIVILPQSSILMDLFYKGIYPESAQFFEIGLILVSIVGMRTAIEYSLVSLRRQKEYLRGMTLVSALYIILCPVFAATYEIMGVFYASITAEIIYTAYLIAMSRHYETPWYYGKKFLNVFAAIIICYVWFSILRPLNTAETIVYYCFGSLCSLFIFQIVSLEDLRKIRTTKN